MASRAGYSFADTRLGCLLMKGTAGATDHDSANRKLDNTLRSSMEIREAAGALRGGRSVPQPDDSAAYTRRVNGRAHEGDLMHVGHTTSGAPQACGAAHRARNRTVIVANRAHEPSTGVSQCVVKQQSQSWPAR